MIEFGFADVLRKLAQLSLQNLKGCWDRDSSLIRLTFDDQSPLPNFPMSIQFQFQMGWIAKFDFDLISNNTI